MTQKARKFDVKFTVGGVESTAIVKTVTAETDVAAVMMALYNMRDADGAVEIVSVAPSKKG